MKDYLLFMDVAGDSLVEYEEANNITLVPMRFMIEDNGYVYTDRSEGLSAESFYTFVKEKKVMRTSQITPMMYEEYFESYLKDGYSCLYLCLSSGLSSQYQASVLASRELKEKYPDVDLVTIDSLHATGGMGILLERMIENKQKGLDIFSNAKDVEALRGNVKILTYVDDLQALLRGGRISATTAFVGGLLNVKPIIKITNVGKLESFAKARGVVKAMGKLVEVVKENIAEHENTTVYITHCQEEENANKVAEMIKEACPNSNVKVRILSPIIGAHLGTGSVVASFEARPSSTF